MFGTFFVKLKEIRVFQKLLKGRQNQRARERPKCPKGELEQSWEVRGGLSLDFAYVWDVFLLFFGKMM
jgi:hypothetical protein